MNGVYVRIKHQILRRIKKAIKGRAEEIKCESKEKKKNCFFILFPKCLYLGKWKLLEIQLVVWQRNVSDLLILSGVSVSAIAKRQLDFLADKSQTIV